MKTFAMKGNSNFFWLGLLIFFFLPGACLAASSTGSGSSPRNTSGKPVQFLTGPNQGDPLGIALAYLQQNKKDLGISSTDITGAKVTDQYTSLHNGITHIYLQQRYHGFEVHGANININIAQDGSVINLGNRFIANIEKAVNTTAPSVSVGQAVSSAATSLGLVISKPLKRVDTGTDPYHQTLNDGGISINPIPVKLVYQPVSKNQVRLAWDLEIYELDAKNWWSMRVDAATGAVLDQVDYVENDSYNVYPLPVESPSHGNRSIVTNPWDATASPSGWIGAGLTCTQGNNVDAYLDTNNSNGPTLGNGDRACNAGLDFDFSINLTLAPSAYQDAAVTNLFYWNNIIHDIFYHYGFDEASGNFQEDNFGIGGLGSDSVNAEAQDGGGTNNANFATPSDGSNPRMQMYIWTSPNPDRDGDLDNGIIIHEYGHGISNRLTGGPGTTLCLNNTEQMGEGWSDFFAVLMTIESGDSGGDRRGVGTYALGQPTDGNGIRAYPYSTDMGIDPRTYDDIKTAAVPHGVGSIWTAMLWDMTWALIDRDGFDSDLYNGSGGNNTALQLVVDGLKLQPCSPGFVDGRDAILLADQNNNGGANQCLIWEAFAKRGLGYSASQGSSSSRTDGAEAFDIPPSCEGVTVSKSADLSSVESGGTLEYTLEVLNNSTDTRTNVIVTDTVPDLTSYIPGSATCGGSESGGVVTFDLGSMSGGASQACSFQVTVNAVTANVLFDDDMESGGGLWSVSHGSGSIDWVLGTINSHSPTHAWFAQDLETRTDQYLAMSNPVSISGSALLRFWHDYDTEVNWDGGVVEISVNGGPWSDLGSAIFQNGYTGTLSPNPDRDIEGEAFHGSSGNYKETLADLSGYAGSNVQIRFRMATDGLVGGLGWYVDDVKILDNAIIFNEACVTADEGDHHCDSVKTPITSFSGPGTPVISVNPDNLSDTQETDQITSQSLDIGNIGTANLEWTLTTDSGSDCTTPDNNVPWVSTSHSDSVYTTVPGATTAVSVYFDSTGLSPAVYSGVLCVNSNDSLNSPFVVDLSMTVSSPPSETIDQPATGGSVITGTVSGSYLDTHSDGGNIQMVTEQHQGGKPQNRHDLLEYVWDFILEYGSGLNFYANAWFPDQGDGDDVNFYFSSDNVNFTWFYTLSAQDSGNVFNVSLPDQPSGAFYVKAKSTNTTPGHNSNETLYIDYMYIREDSSAPPPPPPPPPITMIVSNLQDNSENSNRRNRWNAIVEATVIELGSNPAVPVGGAVVSGTWTNGATGSDSCETNGAGQCMITKSNLKLNVSPVTFTITDVERGADVYESASSVTTRQAYAPAP